MALAAMKKAYVAKHKGSIARNVPRIYNVDKNVEIIGYAEVNQLATSVMGRVKTHRGYFYCANTDIGDGDLILDRQDSRHYLVMFAKNEVFNFETIYIDTTLLYCDTLVTVSRFGGGARDGFGRPITTAPLEIAIDVRCTSQAINFDVLAQEDRPVAHDKIKFYLQQSVGAKPSDRLVTATGEKYMVISVDNASLDGLSILNCDTDVR